MHFLTIAPWRAAVVVDFSNSRKSARTSLWSARRMVMASVDMGAPDVKGSGHAARPSVLTPAPPPQTPGYGAGTGTLAPAGTRGGRRGGAPWPAATGSTLHEVAGPRPNGTRGVSLQEPAQRPARRGGEAVVPPPRGHAPGKPLAASPAAHARSAPSRSAVHRP